MRPRTILLLAVVVGAIGALQILQNQPTAQGTPLTTVSGTIRNTDNGGLGGVTIRAVRAGSTLAAVTSDKEGVYKLQVPGDGPFDVVYEAPGLEPDLVQNLTGRGSSHAISKVILREGQILDPRSRIGQQAARQYLQSLSK
jgi:hypothetical protein